MHGEDSITSLRGIGEASAKLFARLGIHTLHDLADNYPRAYEDYSSVTPISKLRPGTVTIRARITTVTGRYVRRGMHITEAIASDASGSIRLVWFNQPYRATSIKHDKEYYISGMFALAYRRFAIQSPTIELVSDFPVNTARIVPVYRETKGLTSRQLRQATQQCLPYIHGLPETLPTWLVDEQKLISLSEAIEQLHFPASGEHLARAKERLGFEEVFRLALTSLLNKQEILSERAPTVMFDERVAKAFTAHLPFRLTDAQRRAIWQIYLDMQKSTPMNRLVEGDVGSGKTVVAAMAAVMVMHSGHQVAFMAPTEILARQHADTITSLLRPLGLDSQVGLLIGSMTANQKSRARQAIADGRLRFIVGTHALVQESVSMRELELIIIDEQHRFGVEQRKALIAKAGHMPHVLNLTATPIPRSLALTLYGELDISILDTKPAGRQPVVTRLCAPTSRAEVNKEIAAELESGRQAFVVCPIISESSVSDAASAEKVYERLKNRDFKRFNVGLLHGKMRAEDKAAVMQDFLDHRIDILVATTVIEVGVDVPNASVMLVESADRFGLAQIHQLRGRIGRGGHKGYCYLMMSGDQAPSPRMRALERTNDGFKLAELDLSMRGPGAIYGTTQHGQLDLRIAQLSDTKLIARARAAAQVFLDRHERMENYPDLSQHVKRLQAVSNLN
jgi:ATP-dependent DNA helicase RecG